MQQNNIYNDRNMNYNNEAYPNWNAMNGNTNQSGIPQANSIGRSDYSSYVSSDHYTHSNVSQTAHNISKNSSNGHLLQERVTMPNAIYDTASVDENCFNHEACNYLKEKSNSLLYDNWIPKKAKVFVRRIDGSKRPPKETVYRVKNGNYSDEKELPYDLNSRNVFVKEKLKEFEQMPCEYIGANTKRIISSQESQNLLHGSNNDKEILDNFCVVDNHRIHNNVPPLCVREINQALQQNEHCEFPIRPLMQDEYYFRHIFSQRESEGCILNPELIIRFLKHILKCCSKTAVLVIKKIKAELDSTAYHVNFPENTLPNMDVACGVCERTDFQRASETNKKLGLLSFFEEPQKPSGMLNRLLEHFQSTYENETCVENPKVSKKMEVSACYQAEVFPKDENGKVILPKFEA